MANETSRDKVWKFALAACYRNGGSAKPADIADIAGVSERMARDCLLVMYEAGWLDRRTNMNGEVEYICMRMNDFEEELPADH